MSALRIIILKPIQTSSLDSHSGPLRCNEPTSPSRYKSVCNNSINVHLSRTEEIYIKIYLSDLFIVL